MRHLFTFLILFCFGILLSSCGESDGDKTPIPEPGKSANNQPLGKTLAATVGSINFSAVSPTVVETAASVTISGTSSDGISTMVLVVPAGVTGTYALDGSGSEGATLEYSRNNIVYKDTSGTVKVTLMTGKSVGGEFSAGVKSGTDVRTIKSGRFKINY